jgi:hypothetical protein
MREEKPMSDPMSDVAARSTHSPLVPTRFRAVSLFFLLGLLAGVLLGLHAGVIILIIAWTTYAM